MCLIVKLFICWLVLCCLAFVNCKQIVYISFLHIWEFGIFACTEDGIKAVVIVRSWTLRLLAYRAGDWGLLPPGSNLTPLSAEEIYVWSSGSRGASAVDIPWTRDWLQREKRGKSWAARIVHRCEYVYAWNKTLYLGQNDCLYNACMCVVFHCVCIHMCSLYSIYICVCVLYSAKGVDVVLNTKQSFLLFDFVVNIKVSKIKWACIYICNRTSHMTFRYLNERLY